MADLQTIKLRNPIKVNGSDVSELSCDMDAITVDGFMRAETNSKKEREFTGNAAELDYTFHLWLGFEGVKAAMPEMDDSDLKRVHGPDLIKVMQAGRAFLSDSEESDSEGQTSEDASEPTPMSTPRASRK